MKRIINSKRYNTETAEEVASYDNRLGTQDFRGYSESLYKTKTGNWFLSGEGGPRTKYAQPCGNLTGGGKDIIPLSHDQALSWLESHGESDAIEKHFADSIKDA